MSGIEDFIEKWNESIDHFKMTHGFFENPDRISVLDALQAILLYMGYDIEAIKDTPVKDSVLRDRAPILNIARCVRYIHENISTSKKIFCVGDIYMPSPKRILRILRELHNFALYYKVVTDEMQVEITKRNEEAANKRAEIDQLTDKENSLAMALHNWHHKIAKSNANPVQNEAEQLEQEIQEIVQDITELEPRLKQQKEKLAKKEKEGFELKEHIEIVKGQLVLDPESLESGLNDLKKQAKLHGDKKANLEADHKAVMENLAKTNTSIEKWTQFLNVVKKNATTAEVCIKIKEEFDNVVYQYELEDLQKKLEIVQSTVNIKTNELHEVNVRLKAELEEKKKKCITLQRRAQELHQQSIDIQKYIKDSKHTISHAEYVIEQIENMTKAQIQEMEDFRNYVKELIAEVCQETYTHCIKFKSLEEE